LGEGSDAYALSVFPYSFEEDPNRKNFPAPPGSSPPVRFTPLALNLQYLVTSICEAGTESSAYNNEQLLMGLAAKAFHDYPVLDHTLRIPSEMYIDDEAFVLPPQLRDERDEIRIDPHPATLDDLNKVWTACSTPLRLSAIYRVGVILMRPERPQPRPVPVLSRSARARSFHQVWLGRSESDTIYTLPGETAEKKFCGSPATAAFRLIGSGFVSRAMRVLVYRRPWEDPIDVTESWGMVVQSATTVALTVAESPAGPPIVPGIHQIALETDGVRSNAVELLICAAINPTRPASDGDPLPPGLDPAGVSPGDISLTIHGGPFAGVDIDSLEVYIGSHRIAASDLTIERTCIETALPAELTPGFHVVRVVVNGVGSPPTRWLEVRS
jgi:hypothetical protein